MLTRFISAFFALFFLTTPGYAAGNTAADALTAKAYLEELLARRYNQNLGTFIDKASFTVGAQIEIVDAPKKVEPKKPVPFDAPTEETTPMDLFVGTLDTEKIISKVTLLEEKPAIASFLSTKRIKSVFLSVGLKEDLGAAAKAEVEAWLKERVQKEFGNNGKTEVRFLKEVIVKKTEEPKKEWWDWLQIFQNLAGIVFLALTLLIGLLLWRVTTSKSKVTSQNNSESPSIKLTAEGLNGGGGGDNSKDGVVTVKTAEQERKNVEEYFVLSQKVSAIGEKLNSDLENLIRTWSNSGDEGKFKIVCFAEAVGKNIGRLPIPPDAIQEIAKVFSKMATTSVAEKNQTLEKVYWDLMTVLNLGTDVLVQPFSYLANTDADLINQVLMDENPKLKTLVSHYLPDEIRKKFISALDSLQKLEILNSAAKLKSIANDELKSYEQQVQRQLGSGVSSGLVELDMTFEKIVATLSIIEELNLLSQVQGPEILKYKQTHPSIAFIHEWPDKKLVYVLQKMSSDQIVTYLRLKPDLKERVIGLCPEMTAEVVTDDFNQPDRFSIAEKTIHLEEVSHLLLTMQQDKEFNLEEIFSAKSEPQDTNVVSIKTA